MGSFATIYHGIEKNIGKEVAIKRIHVKDIQKLTPNITKEIEIMKELKHPHIVRLYDVIYETYQVLPVLIDEFNYNTYFEIFNDLILNKPSSNVIEDRYNYLMDNDNLTQSIIIKYINHAILYINLNKIKLNDKPSYFGFGFPDELFNYINDKRNILRKNFDDFYDIKYILDRQPHITEEYFNKAFNLFFKRNKKK
jgi:serine/threonine protein kinase